MTAWHVVLLASIVCFALKAFGYLVPATVLERATPARIVNLLTVALLAALISLQTFAQGQQLVLDARVPAVLVAAVLFALRVPFLVVIVAAAAVAAGIRALT
jgi:hypothetical protein